MFREHKRSDTWTPGYKKAEEIPVCFYDSLLGEGGGGGGEAFKFLYEPLTGFYELFSGRRAWI